MENYADLLFIDEVLALQEQDGSAQNYQRVYSRRTQECLSENDRDFIATRESFYIASVSTTGWPYVQHRGGPAGFLKVLDQNKLGFIDYPGNRQFVTMGHAARDSRVALFLMDYERRARMKLLGRLTMQQASDAEPGLCERLLTNGQAKVERIATIDVVAIDWNCPKYIPQLVNINKINALLDSQLKQLIAENTSLKAELDRLQKGG